MKTCHSVVVLCLRAESTHPKHPKEWSPWKQNVDTHKWKASHFFVQATRNTRSWRNLLTADCRHKYILVSPCYKTSIKAFMAATTQSCSDIERTPSSDREVPFPRHKFWTLNKISKRSGQNGPELSGLWTHHKTSLRPQYMPMARQAWKWMCLMCSITPTSTHVSSGFEERYYPPTPRNLPWQEYMTKHALFCITSSIYIIHCLEMDVWNTVASTGMSLTKLIDKPKCKTKQVDTGWQSDSSITQHSVSRAHGQAIRPWKATHAQCWQTCLRASRKAQHRVAHGVLQSCA